jgi:hypothetical protein
MQEQSGRLVYLTFPNLTDVVFLTAIIFKRVHFYQFGHNKYNLAILIS